MEEGLNIPPSLGQVRPSSSIVNGGNGEVSTKFEDTIIGASALAGVGFIGCGVCARVASPILRRKLASINRKVNA
jgi:hypothetical protein